MFVKISEVIISTHEIKTVNVYDCQRVVFKPYDGIDNCAPDEKVAVIDEGEKDEHRVRIRKQGDILTDVYLMNQNGKTIEHYTY